MYLAIQLLCQTPEFQYHDLFTLRPPGSALLLHPVQVLAVLRGIAEEVVGGAVPDAEPLMAVSKPWTGILVLRCTAHTHTQRFYHREGMSSG